MEQVLRQESLVGEGVDVKKLIIIPAFNEANSLVVLVDEIIKKAPDYDYVIVNDGSHDHTSEMCIEKGLNFLDLSLNLGIGGAVQAGYVYARHHGYDIAIQIDGDGQHDPAYLDRLIEPLVKGEADFSLGSRYITKEGFQSSVLRRLGIKWLNCIIRLLTHVKISDCTSGFRAVNKKVIALFARNYPYDYPEPETIVDVHRHGFKITEVPVVMRSREHGTSSIRMFKSVYYMIKVSLAMFVAFFKRR